MRLSMQQAASHETVPLLRSDYSARENSFTIVKLKQNEAETGWRMQTVLWLDGSVYAHWWDCLDGFLNVTSGFIYITMTFYSVGPRDQKLPPPPPQIWQDADIAFAIFLLMQYLPRLYFSLNPFAKMLNAMSILTFISTVAVIWVTSNQTQFQDSFLQAGWLIFFCT